MRILVTGASGFIGRALVARLAADHQVQAASRVRGALPAGVRWVPSPDLDDATAQFDLTGVDCVIHLAAIAHVPLTADADERARVVRVNAHAPARLARQAMACGVRRFVYVSSAKALADEAAMPLAEHALPAPADLYGEVKLAAERALTALPATGGIVIVRPPLVYGPGVRANFLQLVRWVRAGVPLPLGGVHNLRSIVSLWNLVDALTLAASVPEAGGRTLHVTDGVPLSTPDLVRLIAGAAGRRARLVPVPAGLLSFGLRAAGRAAMASRLLGSLVLDDGESRRVLGYTPALSTAEGIRRTVASLR